jgi:hypothetical protein
VDALVGIAMGETVDMASTWSLGTFQRLFRTFAVGLVNVRPWAWDVGYQDRTIRRGYRRGYRRGVASIPSFSMFHLAAWLISAVEQMSSYLLWLVSSTRPNV